MVSVEDNPPSLVVIVRRCLNTRFRPKRAKNAPCKKSNYVQHLLTAWVVLDQHCWFNSDYLDSFWEEAITILLKRPDISVCLNTFAFALLQIDLPLFKSETPVQLCLAASHPIPRVLTGKTNECEFSRGWSAQKCIFLIGTFMVQVLSKS